MNRGPELFSTIPAHFYLDWISFLGKKNPDYSVYLIFKPTSALLVSKLHSSLLNVCLLHLYSLNFFSISLKDPMQLLFKIFEVSIWHLSTHDSGWSICEILKKIRILNSFSLELYSWLLSVIFLITYYSLFFLDSTVLE